MNDIQRLINILRDMQEKHSMTIDEYSDSYDYGYRDALNKVIDKAYELRDGII